MLIFISLPDIGFLNLIWLRVLAFLKTVGSSQTPSADSWQRWEALWPSTAQVQPSCHQFGGFSWHVLFHFTGLESAIDLLLDKWLFLSNNDEIPSQIAIHNPFSGKLYFRGVSTYFRETDIQFFRPAKTFGGHCMYFHWQLPSISMALVHV
jgi:hypothetical protein